MAFHSDRDGCCQIFVMNADGSDVTLVTNNTALNFGPVWSPDGRRIALSSNVLGDFQIFSINADGTGMTQISNAAQAFNPWWSPDGRRIAFTSNRDGNYDVFVMNADGTGVPAKLTTYEATGVRRVHCLRPVTRRVTGISSSSSFIHHQRSLHARGSTFALDQ